MTFRQFAFNNVKRQSRNYAAYFLSSSLSVMIFFLYDAVIYHPRLSTGYMNEFVSGSLTFGTYMLVFFSFLFILYSTRAFVRARKKQFGILAILGMSDKQLRLLLFIEYSIIGLTAITAGIITGIVFLKLFLLTGTKLFGLNELPFYIPLQAIRMTIQVFGVLFLLISPLTYIFVRSSRLIDLLGAQKRRLKTPRKSSIFLALLSVLMLAWAYYKPLQKGTSAGTFLLAALLAIIGMHWFYKHFAPLLIRWLKRNRRFFWKRTHLLWLSDMEFRLKENARMFFLISIVFTFTFMSLSSLILMKSLFSPHLEETFDFHYVSMPGNVHEKAHLQYFEETVQKAHLTYRKEQFELVQPKSLEGGGTVFLMRENDYASLATASGQPIVEINPGEALLISDAANASVTVDKQIKLKDNGMSFRVDKQIKLKDSGMSFRIVKQLEKPLMPTDLHQSGSVLVVSDEAFQAERKQKNQILHFTGYIIPDWKMLMGNNQQIEDFFYRNQEEIRFSFYSKTYNAFIMEHFPNMLLFVGLMITTVYFIAADSFIYFKMYADLHDDRIRFRSISKIGLGESELSQIVTIQIGSLFFIPFIVSFINTMVVLHFLKAQMKQPNFIPVYITLAIICVVQMLYFLQMRSRYIRHLKQDI